MLESWLQHKKSKSSGSYNINMEKKTLLFLIIITNRTTLECEYLDHCVSHLDMHLQILLTLTNRYCWSVPRQDPDTDKPSVYCVIRIYLPSLCVITIPAITLCHNCTCRPSLSNGWVLHSHACKFWTPPPPNPFDLLTSWVLRKWAKCRQPASCPVPPSPAPPFRAHLTGVTEAGRTG